MLFRSHGAVQLSLDSIEREREFLKVFDTRRSADTTPLRVLYNSNFVLKSKVLHSVPESVDFFPRKKQYQYPGHIRSLVWSLWKVNEIK